MNNKINKLLENSKNVIRDCSLENGAIVAGNTDKEYYPKNVQNYRFVWPRDSAFILRAADILDLNIQESFLDWLNSRAEDFSETGTVYHRYLTNGARDPQFGHQYQPDQAGALIWSLSKNNSESKKVENTITKLAEGLVQNWEGKNFSRKTWDLWEEKAAFTNLEENFIYSTASAGKGLKIAYNLTNREKFKDASNEMKDVVERVDRDYYPKSSGIYSDESIDASNIGLVWPFDIVETDRKLENTLEKIENQLLTPEGILRYENDMYDSMLDSGDILKKGAGGWPVLMLWYIIALHNLGEEEKARKNFENYVKKLPEDHLPEQLFSNKQKISVKPLAWSHAMFVITADHLNYI